MSTTALDVRTVAAPTPAARHGLALAQPGRLALLAAVLVAATAGVAAAAGESMIAFWAVLMAFPLVTPAAFGYVVELAIQHGTYAPVVPAVLALVVGVLAFVRALDGLDDL